MSDNLVTIDNHRKLHQFILKSVAGELAQLNEDCYYPKIAGIYKELFKMTNANEKNLIQYSKEKYKFPSRYLIHDPKTTLTIILVQEFLKIKDYTAAKSLFNLFALRTYTNLMHIFIKYCNPIYFKSALNLLSNKHLFNLKQTIPSSILYLSDKLFIKHKDDLIKDKSSQIVKLIMEIRGRFFQSIRSFADKYYKVSKQELMVIKAEEEKDYIHTHEKNIRKIVSDISSNITVYGHIDFNALNDAQKLLKFNKEMSHKYIKILHNPYYTNLISTVLYLLLKDFKDFSLLKSTKYIDYIKKLMSIKISKQQMYFKKTITEIHDKIISDLKIEKEFKKLSIQTQAVSRNFIAYYLAFYVRNFI